LTAAGQIVVRYGVYRGNDPFCCPLSLKRIVYRWNGGASSPAERRRSAAGDAASAYISRRPERHPPRAGARS
jgi:hypothetical protein